MGEIAGGTARAEIQVFRLLFAFIIYPGLKVQ